MEKKSEPERRKEIAGKLIAGILFILAFWGAYSWLASSFGLPNILTTVLVQIVIILLSAAAALAGLLVILIIAALLAVTVFRWKPKGEPERNSPQSSGAPRVLHLKDLFNLLAIFAGLALLMVGFVIIYRELTLILGLPDAISPIVWQLGTIVIALFVAIFGLLLLTGSIWAVLWIPVTALDRLVEFEKRVIWRRQRAAGDKIWQPGLRRRLKRSSQSAEAGEKTDEPKDGGA